MGVIDFNFQKKVSGSQGELNLSLEGKIPPGQFITLSGNSGTGKTTLLRMIAGLTNPDQGQLQVHNKVWYNSLQNISLKPQDRSVAMVFQDLALFPNMTAEGNIQYASNNHEKNNIEELIDIMEIGELRHRKPNQLSRGQQQRVALARAIIQAPKVLLLDEPFSALDNHLKSKLIQYLEKIHRKYELTTILVSHHPEIASHIANVSWSLNNGKITINDLPSKSEEVVTIETIKKKDGKYILTLSETDTLKLEAGSKLKKL